MSKKKLGSFNDWINAYFQPFICLQRYEHFLANIFCKVSLALLNIIQSFWKDLMETLRSHENLWSLTDLNGADIGFRSNSRDCFFWKFMISKNQSINEKKRVVSAASGGLYANRILLTELSTWAASPTFIFEYRVNLICSFESFGKMCQTAFSIFIKNSRNVIPKYEHIIVPHASQISTFTRTV